MNWLDYAPLFCLGLAYGLAIGALNHFIMVRGWQKVNEYHIERAKRRLMARYMLRLAIYFVALLLVFRHVPMLIGAGIGMVLIPKFLAIKYIKLNKGVKK